MTAIKKLTAKDIEKHIALLDCWTLNARKTEISKLFATTSFISALAFVARITVHAEVLGHHPVIELSHSKVKVRLSTEDVKALTKLDFDLAKKIDGLKI